MLEYIDENISEDSVIVTLCRLYGQGKLDKQTRQRCGNYPRIRVYKKK